MRKAFALFLASFLFAAPAFAGDEVDEEARPASESRIANVFGASGLITIPSAYSQRDGTATAYFTGNGDFIGGGVLGGWGADRLGFEAGVSVLDFDNASTEVLGNLKLTFLQETDTIPALAVGVIDVADSLDIGQSWYVVASKYFTRQDTDQDFALKGHFGFGGGIYDEEVFGGAELFFGPNLSGLVDVANGEVNVGGRYQSGAFNVMLYLVDLDRFGGSLNYAIRFR